MVAPGTVHSMYTDMRCLVSNAGGIVQKKARSRRAVPVPIFRLAEDETSGSLAPESVFPVPRSTLPS